MCVKRLVEQNKLLTVLPDQGEEKASPSEVHYKIWGVGRLKKETQRKLVSWSTVKTMLSPRHQVKEWLEGAWECQHTGSLSPGCFITQLLFHVGTHQLVYNETCMKQ